MSTATAPVRACRLCRCCGPSTGVATLNRSPEQASGNTEWIGQSRPSSSRMRDGLTNSPTGRVAVSEPQNPVDSTQVGTQPLPESSNQCKACRADCCPIPVQPMSQSLLCQSGKGADRKRRAATRRSNGCASRCRANRTAVNSVATSASSDCRSVERWCPEPPSARNRNASDSVRNADPYQGHRPPSWCCPSVPENWRSEHR